MTSADDAQRQMWDAIEERRIGMLSLSKSGLHAQPMQTFVERRRKRLWFIARRDDEFVREIGDGGCGAFVFQGQDLLASISGALHVVEDRRRMARFWNAEIAAWLPEGPHDPKLTLLRMDCVDAEVWVAGVGLTRFAWEIAWTGGRQSGFVLGDRAGATLH